MMNELIRVTRKTQVNGDKLQVLAENGRVVWEYDALELAVTYFTMPPEQFYARHMFLWVPVEPFATIALAKLGGCRV